MSDRHAGRLRLLRDWLHKHDLRGFFLPRTDPFASEYLSPDQERVAWLTGFTGSLAQVVVLDDEAAVFSDGRYTAQLKAEVDERLFASLHVLKEPPANWLAGKAREGDRIGVDPFLVTRGQRDRLRKALHGQRATLVDLTSNPIDAVWQDRPAAPLARVERWREEYAGVSSADKRRQIAATLTEKRADWLLLTATDAIAWLLNVRGRDVPFNPLCLSFALLKSDGSAFWFVDRRKLGPAFTPDAGVEVEEPAAFLRALDGLGSARARVAVDPKESHAGFLDRLERAGAALVEVDNPVVLAKARKNERERRGAVEAQRRDGAAVVRFLCWLDAQPHDGTVSELRAAERLNLERSEDPLFEGECFATVSAFGAHAALPHYRASIESNAKLRAHGIYLVDSGGQYRDATTDITRTVVLGEPTREMRERFTLVLKGHVAVATATFPVDTWGSQLDTLARVALWRAGLDFDHGTGHGVGAYLCVHEGPARLSKQGNVALTAGMILSNEPGYYKEGAYGIRIENLVMVEERGKPEGADRELLGFKTLTLCPIDRRLIDRSMLTAAEHAWVDDYHARVLRELSPLLDDAQRQWLAQSCEPL